MRRITPDLNRFTISSNSQVHFALLPGSVAKNRHLFDRWVA